MKFRFLGDGDCPDWLLAEINSLSRMTSIKMKLLGQMIVKLIINEDQLDEDKVKKLTHDAKLDFDDAKAIIAAIELILTSSVRYGVNATDLSSELQQLGLPREHSVALGKLYTENFTRIMESLSSRSLRLSRLASVNVISSDKVFVNLSLVLKNKNNQEIEKFVNLSKSDVPVILTEMKKVRAIMDGV
ncbi:hypothetical protein HCN44_003565 [Aphidius gifuensis]|uniref:COMM domain-containing protein n=2 Tax=Braconidae TaxID=7402 RepID=A0A834XIX2_APHGI|nr:COMM domain-containing protein 4 [Aphidius gifuensis]KAF7987702.1 hypothetical protein HCN44_003565 [Aphidius gifuensis]